MSHVDRGFLGRTKQFGGAAKRERVASQIRTHVEFCPNLCGKSQPIKVADDKLLLSLMIFRVLTSAIIRSLDWCARRILPDSQMPTHLRVGVRGEEDAYFFVRKAGYTVVARNYRSPRYRGEIDLIAWEQEVLCFLEVKTRTSRNWKTAEAAVDRHKRREVAQVVRDYLRRMPPSCQWRFDVVSVYYDDSNSRPQIEVFRNASLAA